MDGNYLLLIDGSSLLSTQFFGNLPREILFAKTPEEKEKYFHKIMMTSKGVYTNAVYGFLRTLLKILKDQKPAYLAVAWDLSRNTFRRELYPDYKGNRSDTMEPLREQYDLCQEVLKRMNIVQLMDERYEADDFCGTASRKFQDQVPVRIFTKDHDYLQLVTDRTHMWLMHSSQDKTDEMDKKYGVDRATVNIPDRAVELDPELVKAEFGVTPEQVSSLKGLQGDSSDNIKGVPGIGPQTAVRLINEYGTVDNLYKALEDLDKEKEAALKAYWKEKLGITRSPLNFLLKTSDTELVGEKAARLSEQLATIKTDIDLGDLKMEDLRTAVDREELKAILSELEFASLEAELEEEPSEKSRDIRGGFEMITDLTEAEETLKSLSKSLRLGLAYRKGLGLAVSAPEGKTFYFPEQFFIDETFLKQAVLSLEDAGAVLYAAEGKPIRKLSGIIARDVSIGAYLLEPLRGSFDYAYIAETWLSEHFPKEEVLLKKPGSKEAADPLSEEVRDCLCYTAYTALEAAPVIEEKLAETGMLSLYETIELPVMGILSDMEDAGIRVEREALEQFAASLKKTIDGLEKEIHELAGEAFNINSPKQLAEILFVKMKLPYGKKTKSGYSTAADILEKLAPKYPIVRKVLEYRTYAKLYSTYAEGLQAFISDDGRIHGTFNQTVTATGRLSSANPNLQNIPVRLDLGRQIRKVFVPDNGCVFIDADYSQIELRVLASLSGDENLINAYRDAKDIHAMTASQVFHVPLEDVTPEMRSNAKAVNFGIVYGISAFGLSDNLSITRDEAKAYMESYFETYPGIKGFLDSLVSSGHENGYVTTLYGRRRPIPELDSVNFNQRSFGERAAMNSPIQGTAADIMKIAMIRVAAALKKEGLKTRIVLQIHDELLLEAPEEEADRAEAILVNEMEHAADLKVRLEVSAKRGYSWYDTK